MDKHTFKAENSDILDRLDKILVQHFEGKSRQYFQHLFEKELVTVNSRVVKSSARLKVGDMVEVTFPEDEELKLEAREIPLDIVYEDKNILVINKQPGLVVHPGTHGSHVDDSLVNAILHHCKGGLGGINGTLRPGIVHRLDKDTSGLLVVAKNDYAQNFLMEQFAKKEVDKIYYALLIGHLEPQKGEINAPIGRSLRDRKKMAVLENKTSKEAITRYEVVRYLENYTLVKVFLLTGRTHQIRVHFASIGFPLVGDQTYGKGKVNHYFEEHYGLRRQFLHAASLSFVMPAVVKSPKKTSGTGGAKKAGALSSKADNAAPQKTKKREFESSLPFDLQTVLDGLVNSR